MSLFVRRLVLIALFSLATLSSLGQAPSAHRSRIAIWIPPEPLVASASQR